MGRSWDRAVHLHGSQDGVTSLIEGANSYVLFRVSAQEGTQRPDLTDELIADQTEYACDDVRGSPQARLSVPLSDTQDEKAVAQLMPRERWSSAEPCNHYGLSPCVSPVAGEIWPEQSEVRHARKKRSTRSTTAPTLTVQRRCTPRASVGSTSPMKMP